MIKMARSKLVSYALNVLPSINEVTEYVMGYSCVKPYILFYVMFMFQLFCVVF